jgi:hypothetical protein
VYNPIGISASGTKYFSSFISTSLSSAGSISNIAVFKYKYQSGLNGKHPGSITKKNNSRFVRFISIGLAGKTNLYKNDATISTAAILHADLIELFTDFPRPKRTAPEIIRNIGTAGLEIKNQVISPKFDGISGKSHHPLVWVIMTIKQHIILRASR